MLQHYYPVLQMRLRAGERGVSMRNKSFLVTVNTIEKKQKKVKKYIVQKYRKVGIEKVKNGNEK